MTNGDNADLYLRSWDGEASKLSDVKEETVGSNENSYKKKKNARKGSIHFGEMMMTGGRVECKRVGFKNIINNRKKQQQRRTKKIMVPNVYLFEIQI